MEAARHFRQLSRHFSYSRIKYTQALKKDISRGTLPAAYQAKVIESNWYDWWEGTGCFNPSYSDSSKFTLILPPPNVTGTLHLGHALTATVEDVVVRWRRMKGDSVMWIPGLDHAGIATQVVVEKLLQRREKKTKHELGRDEFVRLIERWKEEKKDVILEQLRLLGLSLCWERQTFTMDPLPTKAINEAFIRLFEKNVIYRAEAPVNWSCSLQSSISDIEVDFKEIDGPVLLPIPGCSDNVEFGVLHDVAYPILESDLEIVVSTTRPETILGDTAVALHPDDPRRQSLQGKFVINPVTSEKLPIIFDSFVDLNMGTGAVKITPAHDFKDFEVGQRHQLKSIQVFDESGRIINFEEYRGLNRLDVRKSVVDKLKSLEMHRGVKPHKMEVPICSRSGDVVEMMLKQQWFVRCSEAAALAKEAVETGRLELVPKSYEKLWHYWLGNIRDWNISRQLWWGHQIPAYEITLRSSLPRSVWVAANSEEEAKLKVARDDILSIRRDPDVLDTWFSSSLFPLYSLGWPDVGTLFYERYPMPLLNTGHDILFFWVARMVMMGTLLTGEIPFRKVLLHGIVCDAKGRKMSKSLGNVVAPEDVISGVTADQLKSALLQSHINGLITDKELKTSLAGQKALFPNGIPECGVDALRFTLCSQNIQGQNISFDVTTANSNKLFCNKILQAYKYFLSASDKLPKTRSLDLRRENMNGFDLWILSRLALTVESVNEAFTDFHLHHAAIALKSFLYWDFCDVYLESTKLAVWKEEEIALASAVSVLFHSLKTSMCLLHPIMPFISEEIYQRLPDNAKESIMTATFPKVENWMEWIDPKLDECMENINNIVTTVRKVKALCGSQSKEKPSVVLTTADGDVAEFCRNNLDIIKFISRSSHFSLSDSALNLGREFIRTRVNDKTTLFLKIQVDRDVLKKRLEDAVRKEEKLNRILTELEKVMGKEDYINASEKVRTNNREKYENVTKELERIKEFTRLIN